VTPDFHFLLERDDVVLTHHRHTAKHHDLSAMTLIATPTIHPEIGGMFQNAVFFFRPAISPTYIFRVDSKRILQGMDPHVANAALLFAQVLGFKAFHFFGLDMGTADANQDHAKDSWATTFGTGSTYTFDIPVPGNFGGQVLASREFLWARKGLETSIAADPLKRTYVNYGLGARIEGATPRDCAEMNLPADVDKAAVRQGLLGSFSKMSGSTFEDAWRNTRLAESIPGFCEDLLACLADHRDLTKKDYLAAILRLITPARTPRPERLALQLIFRGSMISHIKTAEVYLQRIADPGERAAVATIAHAALVEALQAFRDQAVAHIKALEGELTSPKGPSAF
jgi:hypothetical protein